jgi:hypothetical protein
MLVEAAASGGESTQEIEEKPLSAPLLTTSTIFSVINHPGDIGFLGNSAVNQNLLPFSICQVSSDEFGSPKHHFISESSGQVSLSQISIFEMALPELTVTQISPGQISVLETDLLRTAFSQVSLSQVSIHETDKIHN